ncbi:MAG: aspartate/glutamate racemase family protein [candidate division KSB1 bacterium]|jgi:glutamate racemase|nr:aspartate/glutamate racemase family protein [candidate division KSB1 bacterium]
MVKRNRFLCFTLILLLFAFLSCAQRPDVQRQIDDLFQKKNVTILVTDSGLGGLSVAADLTERLPESGVFDSARVVFFNSLFHNRSGYNSLSKVSEKVRIFNIALNAMAEKYEPDLLLIACNTLSVLYDKTDFSKRAPFPVIGIVETGVDLIAEQLDKSPDANAIIFATKTTIASGAHKKQLMEQGFSGDRIIGQPCHRLAGSIERGYDSEKTIGYIEKFVKEALQRVDREEPVFASFNCTHYGYAMQQFRDAFAAQGYPDIAILDPNPKMADFLFADSLLNRYDSTQVSTDLVSRVTISEEKMHSLGALMERVSPRTAEALRGYTYDPDLFDAKFDTTKI